MKRKMLKKFVISNKYLREIFFFIFRKKINRSVIDKRIKTILNSDKKLSIFLHKEVYNNYIVSLTTYGDRVNELQYTLYSLVLQNVRPKAIYVWLDKDTFTEEKLPLDLLLFKKFNIYFKFTKDLRSYTKLIPQLTETPNSNVVVCDDDIFYHRKWLEKLIDTHKKHPDEVICHIAHEIKKESNNELKPYNNWKHNIQNSYNSSKLYFPCGVGGVIWNLELLFKDYNKFELFTSFSPLADDVWFYFMAYLNGKKVRIVHKPFNRLKYIDIYKEYGLNNKSTLQSENVLLSRNDEQIKKIMDYYQIETLEE
jgi:hypothetical protein